jgi:glycosyltransferase involved in cell wall biosynthesis
LTTTVAYKNTYNLSRISINTVARLSPEKGIDVALRAIAQLKNGAVIRYLVAGDGTHKEKLKRVADNFDLTDSVEFIGRINHSQLSEIYTQADIFILPSLSEGIPKVILEAMAAGIPVVATRVGGIPDLIGDNQERGWLVSSNDESALADAISQCLNDSEIRCQKLAEAHKYIKSCTMEAQAANIEQTLDEVLGIEH